MTFLRIECLELLTLKIETKTLFTPPQPPHNLAEMNPLQPTRIRPLHLNPLMKQSHFPTSKPFLLHPALHPFRILHLQIQMSHLSTVKPARQILITHYHELSFPYLYRVFIY